MLFGGDGQQLGMLSGGCLESDIQKHARRVMHSGKSLTVSYDGSDEDDMSFQLGIGCGGTVHIQLQPVAKDNHYQQLDKVYQALKQRQSCQYIIDLAQAGFEFTHNRFTADVQTQKTQMLEQQGRTQLSIAVTPPPHLLLVGGGIDARPVVAMATQMGWQVSLFDPRPANARREHFLTADNIVNCDIKQLGQYSIHHKVDCAVLMSHNLTMDAQALSALVDNNQLKYLALLGPKNRRADVLQKAGLGEQQLPPIGLHGPAGFDIGGELPESIALSILSQCHAQLHGKLELEQDGSFMRKAME